MERYDERQKRPTGRTSATPWCLSAALRLLWFCAALAMADCGHCGTKSITTLLSSDSSSVGKNRRSV